MSDTHDTLMWEVRAADGQLSALLDWAERMALPAVRSATSLRCVDVYESEQDRVVAILRFDGEPTQLPEPPSYLVHRAPHQWTFRHVREFG